MASIQQSIGGLTGSIFAATAMGSHLVQGTPEYQAYKKYRMGMKLAEQTGEPLKEELNAHDLAQQRAEEYLGEAVLLNPTEKYQRAYSEQVEYNREMRENAEDWERQLQAEQERKRASEQFARMVMTVDQRDLSRRQTESYQQEFERRRGANK